MTDAVRLVKKNVFSQKVFDEIHNALYDAVTGLGVKWSSESHRRNFIEAIDDYLSDVEDTGVIQQPRCLCDRRNNPNGFNGPEVVFEVRYKQPHCAAFTYMIFHIDVT